MNKRWLLNILMAVIVGALALLAAYGPGPGKIPSAAPLTPLQPGSIQKVRLIRPGQKDIVLLNSGGEWVMTAPYQARANEFRVNDFVGIASSPTSFRFAAQTDQLRQFGLLQPSATLVLDNEEVQFGSMHPIQNQIYVLNAKQVSLIDASALRIAAVRIEDLYSPRPLGANPKLEELSFPGFGITKNETGAWRRSPELKELSSDTVNRFVDEWRNAIALSVSRWPARKMGNRVRITLRVGEKQKNIDLFLVQRRPELILARPDEGLAYHFPAEVADRLLELRHDPAVPAFSSQPRPFR